GGSCCPGTAAVATDGPEIPGWLLDRGSARAGPRTYTCHSRRATGSAKGRTGDGSGIAAAGPVAHGLGCRGDAPGRQTDKKQGGHPRRNGQHGGWRLGDAVGVAQTGRHATPLDGGAHTGSDSADAIAVATRAE